MADRNGYIGRAPGDSSVVVARQVYTPTTDTTTFTFSSGYTVGYLEVYLNGSKLISGSGNDYVASNGSTVVLNAAAVSGDVVEIVAYKAFNVTAVTDAPGNFTVGGDLTVDGSATVGGVSVLTTTGDGSALSGVVTTTGDGSALSGIVTGITAGDNISVSGATGNVTITGLANTSDVRANTLVVSGITTLGSSNGIGTVTIGIGTEALHVDGNARVVGILTVGTASVTIDGVNNKVTVGSGVTIDSTGIDLSQTTTGIALPQGTTAQRPTGDNPYLRWNTTNSALEFYNGTDWVEIISDYFPSGSTILG
jgi:hypothetical protein